jgi:exonuclease VII small subunit
MWRKYNDGMSPQGADNTLTAYTEAVEEFSSSTAEFLSHIPLLTNARDAYQRAMEVSTQLRKVLDAGDETLRTVMDQLNQAVKVETIPANGDKADAARA